MSNNSTPSSQVQHQTHRSNQPDTSLWQQLLLARRLSQETFRRASLKPNGTGWLYPVRDVISGEVLSQRLKRYPEEQGPKYAWIPSKPESVEWYTLSAPVPLPKLIEECQGVLWLANGEADVWALDSAGIYNAACTLRGEGNLPPTFAADLVRWGVRELRMAPDRDAKGLDHAVAVRDALQASGIDLDVFELPASLGDKADLNTAWIAYQGTPDGFEAQLLSLPFKLLPGPSAAQPPLPTTSERELPQGFYEAIEAALHIQSYQKNGWSKRIPCIFAVHHHDDRSPAAAWHRDKHIYKCFKCSSNGDFALAVEVGEQLGLDWRDYRHEAVPVPQRKSPKGRRAAQPEDASPQADKPVRDKPTTDEIGEIYIARTQGNLHVFWEQWYCYQDGIWHRYQMIEKVIWDLLKEMKAFGMRPAGTPKRDVLDYLAAQVRVPDDLVDQGEHYINVRNGLVNLSTLALEPHKRELYLTSQLPFAYDLAATCPRWEKWLQVMLITPEGAPDPGLVLLLQEAFGYSLTADTSLEKAFLLFGEASTGKSTVLGVLQELAGDAHTTLDLSALGQNSYPLAELAGKRVATCSEASVNSPIADDKFKQLVSGEPMPMRQIYQRPFTLKPRAKLWWAMNHLPRVNERGNAVYRRLIIIPFLRVIPPKDVDPSLKQSFSSELAGIFNWALAGLARLRQQGHFTSVSQVEALVNEYQEENDVEALFLEERCDLSPNASLSANALYKAYRDWCLESGYQPKAKGRVGRDWQRLGLKPDRNRHERLYVGAMLKTP